MARGRRKSIDQIYCYYYFLVIKNMLTDCNLDTQKNEGQRVVKLAECQICTKPMSFGLIMFRFCGHVFHSDCVTDLVSGLAKNDSAIGNIGCPFQCYQNPELTASIDQGLLQDLPPRAVKLQLNYENVESEILRERFTEFLAEVSY